MNNTEQTIEQPEVKTHEQPEVKTHEQLKFETSILDSEIFTVLFDEIDEKLNNLNDANFLTKEVDEQIKAVNDALQVETKELYKNILNKELISLEEKRTAIVANSEMELLTAKNNISQDFFGNIFAIAEHFGITTQKQKKSGKIGFSDNQLSKRTTEYIEVTFSNGTRKQFSGNSDAVLNILNLSQDLFNLKFPNIHKRLSPISSAKLWEVLTEKNVTQWLQVYTDKSKEIVTSDENGKKSVATI
jgi:hypothetical protein